MYAQIIDKMSRLKEKLDRLVSIETILIQIVQQLSY